MTDTLRLAAASGSDGGLGKIGTIPVTSGVLYVRMPCGANVEKAEWVVKCDRNATFQLYRAASIVDSATLTLASMADTETLFINGLTFTGESTEEDAVASARKYLVGGTDAAAATALAALINDASYGVPGVVATAAAAVVTIKPDPDNPAYLLQPVTGTAAGHCTVAVATLASLIRSTVATEPPISYTAVTTDSGLIVPQLVNGWAQAYLGISAPAAGAATVVVDGTRYAYRE